MAELPENLQVIKPEGSQLPETEAQPRRLIKERLNLHVKRRLQNQDQQQEPQQIAQINTHPSSGTPQRLCDAVENVPTPQQISQLSNINVNSAENDVTAPQSTLKRKEKQQQQVKIRKPYQKRADKSTSKTQMQITGTEEGGKTRKNKRQKQPGSLVGTAVEATVGNAAHSSGAAAVLSLSPAVEEGSCGGGDDTEGRDNIRKSAPILDMVLSAKKRALMQNPEVKEFLGKVMAAFKN